MSDLWRWFWDTHPAAYHGWYFVVMFIVCVKLMSEFFGALWRKK
jgi:hypothetical protein